MAENDPYAERKKNVESTAANRDKSGMERNPDTGGQGRDEDDETTSVKQRTNIGSNEKTGKDMNEDEEESA